jgi:hypothetical protein
LTIRIRSSPIWRARLLNHDDRFSVVWVEGRGSSTHVGGCDPHDLEEEVDPESEGEPTDSLVVVRDASASQVRQLIQELHGLPREDREAMIDALGLDRRARARL